MTPSIPRNIRARWDATTYETRIAGAAWYRDAHVTLANIGTQYGYSSDTVCAVCAALSPGSAWHRNIEDTRALIAAYPDTVIVGSYGTPNVNKARRVVSGESPLAVLSGPKVVAFYHALSTRGEHPTAIVLDRHMYRVAFNKDASDNEIRSRLRPSAYDTLATPFIRFARSIGVTPSTLQATLWLHWLSYGVITRNPQPASVAA